MASDSAEDRIRRGAAPRRADAYPVDSAQQTSGAPADDLPSLAQSERAKQINSARWTLIIVGIITIVANLIFLFMVPGQIDQEVRKLGVDPRNVPPQVQLQVSAALFLSYLVLGASAALGVVFIVLGVIVRHYPVPCTILGLVLYIGAAVVAVVINPASLSAGWIIKVIIVVSLFKAVQAALAAERDKRTALAGMDDD